MLGDRIKHMRKAAGLSQVVLAQKLGISQSTLSGYETDSSMPNFDMVEKIAAICDFQMIFRDKISTETV